MCIRDSAQYALQRSTEGYQKFLEDLPGAISDVEKSTESQAEKQRQINELYRSGTDAATKMADDTVNAYNEAADGTLSATQKLDIWNSTMLAAAQQAEGPARDAILAYVAATNEIPPDIATYITALVEQGKLAEAQALLDDTSTSRNAAINAEVDQASADVANAELDRIAEFERTGSISVEADTRLADAQMRLWLLKWANAAATIHVNVGGGRAYESAEGRYVPAGSNMISTFGEAGPEAILPLDKAGRLRQLLADPRIGGPVMRALGMGAGGQATGGTAGAADFMRELFSGGGIDSKAYGDYLGSNGLSWQPTTPDAATAGGGAQSAAPDIDELMARKAERGDITQAAYDQWLAHQQAQISEEEKYSDRAEQIWRIREQIKRDQIAATKAAEDEAARNRDELQRAAEKAAADEQAMKDAAIQREDARMQWLYDHQQISYAEYVDYLGKKLAGEETFSTGWIAIHAQMDKIRDDETAKVKQAAADQLQAQKDLIAATFDNWRLQLHLTDAIQDQAETYQALQDAAMKVWVTAQTGEGDLGAAQADYEAAKARAAAAVIDGADARANAMGLQDDTAEWVAFMRSEIGAFIPGHQDLAGPLQQYLAQLPHFARGGYVPARPGGTLGVLAEAGQGEFALPESKLQSMLAAASWSGTQMPSSSTSAPQITIVVPNGAIDNTVHVLLDGRLVDARIETAIDRYDSDTAQQIKAGQR